MVTIFLLSGSLRASSVNTGLLRAYEQMGGDKIRFVWGDANLPLYNEELEEDFPKSAGQLRNSILESDGVILASPEYNRAMSGVMKNAIDWASRPYGENAWKGKPVLAVSVSPGSIAGALAVYQMKQSLLHLDACVLGQPEVMVGGAFEKFDDQGELTDEKTRKFLEGTFDAFLKVIEDLASLQK